MASPVYYSLCLYCGDDLNDIAAKKCPYCMSKLDNKVCQDCLPDLRHTNCGDYKCSSSSLCREVNSPIQAVKKTKVMKLTYRIQHAILTVVAKKISWSENLEKLKEISRESLSLISMIQDDFTFLSKLVRQP